MITVGCFVLTQQGKENAVLNKKETQTEMNTTVSQLESNTSFQVETQFTTIDRLSLLEKEIEFEKNNTNLEAQDKVRQVAAQYINLRYNNFENAETILEKLKPITETKYFELELQNIYINRNEVAGNMIEKSNDKVKVIKDFCDTDDVFMGMDTYDGAVLYMPVCRCKISDEIYYYYQLTVINENGTFLVTGENCLTRQSENKE